MTTPAITPASRQAPVRLTWGGIEEIVCDLAVRADGDGKPETIVGIMRGGMIPAVMIAHRLGIRDVRTIEVTHTATDGVNAVKTSVPAHTNPASLGDLAGRDVLLVDDIAGSGATLERTRRMVEALGVRQLRAAALTVNLANWTATEAPEQRIDYVGERTDTWVIFPWETGDRPSVAGTPTAGHAQGPAPCAVTDADQS
ncbi:phosphoribosyltransferase family protein [Streptomyces abikoensis]|uniref:phosphoribosyltransferase n=1 Tax=Streptomyces abikoensis TaxID=97398 RepID=UPI0033EDF2ED